MEHVKDILASIEHKHHECIDELDFAYDALHIMKKKNVGCILVLKEGILVGLFSEQGHARNVIVKGLSSWKSLLKSIMRTDYSTVTSDTTMKECTELFKLEQGRYLPVMSGDDVIGVVSIEDVDHSIMRDQQAEIELLKDYVYSRRH